MVALHTFQSCFLLVDNVLSDVVESWDSIGVYSILRIEHGKLSGAV